ncbi:hypothetical protein OF83DRAFT_1084353 [Amylostereum chailletii]|nr:hypothetical protein OF83DRAFT_1084353 [Amylostereum chailletii]
MPMPSPPSHARVLVVGGGPAGSYAATALAREGFDVVLFEATTFPRYHVGEASSPPCDTTCDLSAQRTRWQPPVLPIRFPFSLTLSLFSLFIGRRYIARRRHEIQPAQARRMYVIFSSDTDFVALGANNSAWNVARADFDALLIGHARDEGVRVFQNTKVTSVEFDSDGRPISATWVRTDSSSPPPSTPATPNVSLPPSPPPSPVPSIMEPEACITFDFLIDATGRAGLLSTRYLKNRRYNRALRNVAMWGYWRDTDTYGRGTKAEGAPWFEALTDESGWAWFIPLAGGITSVGIVRDRNAFAQSRSQTHSPTSGTPIPSTPARMHISPVSPFSPSIWAGSSWASSATSIHTTPPSSPTHAKSSSMSFSSPFGFGMFSPGGSLGFGRRVSEDDVCRIRHSTTDAQEAQRTVLGARERYFAALELAPGVKALLGKHATIMKGGDPSAGARDLDDEDVEVPSIRHSTTDAQEAQRTVLGARERYFAALELAPGVKALLGKHATIMKGGDPSAGARDLDDEDVEVPSFEEEGSEGGEDRTIRTASDYSYSAATYSGPGFRIVGDAGAFIDPFFSSGVHLAVTSALAAAASISAVARGECEEGEASTWFGLRVAVSYTRFLVVVLSAYKQMRSQNADVLSDIDEDNFDRAFKALRPVIQGNADLGPKLSEVEVQRALDFCSELFTPTTPAEHEAVRVRLAGTSLGSPPPVSTQLPRPSSPLDNVPDLPSSPNAGPTTPKAGRKRSGTIDRVWKWLGNMKGDGPGEQGQPHSPHSPQQMRPARTRRGTISTGDQKGSSSPISDEQQRIIRDTTPPRQDAPPRPLGDALETRALFDVSAPVVSQAVVEDVVRRARQSAGQKAEGLLPACDIGPSFSSPPPRANRPAPLTLAPPPTFKHSTRVDIPPSPSLDPAPTLAPAASLRPPPTLARSAFEPTSLFSSPSIRSAPVPLPQPYSKHAPRPSLALAQPTSNRLSAEEEDEMRRVLAKINARRLIHREHSGLHSLEEEALADEEGGGGMRVRLVRGRLGLERVRMEDMGGEVEG